MIMMYRIFYLLATLCVGANAQSTSQKGFNVITLPEAVTISLPNNWTAWTKDELGILASQAKEKAKKIDVHQPSSYLAYAANFL
jgi:hypothetical protein